MSTCRTHNVHGDQSHPQFQAFTGGLGTQPPTDEGGLLAPYLHMYCGKTLPYLGIILFLHSHGFFPGYRLLFFPVTYQKVFYETMNATAIRLCSGSTWAVEMFQVGCSDLAN